MATIGVISSISLPKPFRNAFEHQLGRAADSVIYFDQVGYDKNLLTEAATAFTGYAKVDLVVTFGGTIAFTAINSLSANTTSFISLVGAVPPSSSLRGHCLGGVSLETANHNTPQPVSVTFSGSTVTFTSGDFKNKDRVAFFAGSGGTLPGGPQHEILGD